MPHGSEAGGHGGGERSVDELCFGTIDLYNLYFTLNRLHRFMDYAKPDIKVNIDHILDDFTCDRC
jgi:hypothetical protein